MAYARFSRHQETSVTTVPNYDTVWTIEHLDPNQRYPMKSQVVPVNEPVIIEHCGTSHYLASDLVEYRNDFGIEYEVCVHSFATLNKSQSLALEKAGKLNRDLPTKFQTEQNMWTFVTSKDPSTDYEIQAKKKIPPEELLILVKQKLLERGNYGIRGLGLIFKNMDKSGNRKLDPEEFYNAMEKYGISISIEVINKINTR